MEDNEKDKIIKEVLKQDKQVSEKANEIFKKIKYNKNGSNVKKHNLSRWITAVAAMLIVIAISGGSVVWINKNKINDNGNVEISTQNITNVPSATSTVIVKNEEIKVEDDNTIVKESENDSVKAVLLKDNTIGIQLKDEFLKEENLDLDSSKMYKVQDFRLQVKDIFVGYLGGIKAPWVMLLMEDSTVDCIQIMNWETVDENQELSFYDQGQIMGLTNIVKFEQASEETDEDDKITYNIYAIRKDGVKKSIEPGKYNDMEEYSTSEKTFESQDGENQYSAEIEGDSYVQASGYAGASNNVYYINNGCLYHLDLSNGVKTKLVYGVSDIWKENEQIIVKMSDANIIYKTDSNIILREYEVSNSKVIDKKENDSLILSLKEDGSITFEFKQGGISKLTTAQCNKKEGVQYNYYVSGYGKMQGNVYWANAKAIYLGTLGTKGKIYITYVTEDNKVVTVNLEEYLMETNRYGMGIGYSSKYTMIGSLQENISKIQKKIITIKLSNGEEVKCDSIVGISDDGKKSDILSESIILNKEGYSNYEWISTEYVDE